MTHSNSFKNKNYKVNIRKSNDSESISLRGLTETSNFQRMHGGVNCDGVDAKDANKYIDCVGNFIEVSDVKGADDLSKEDKTKINNLITIMNENLLNTLTKEEGNDVTSKTITQRIIYANIKISNIANQYINTNRGTFLAFLQKYVNDLINFLTENKFYNEIIYKDVSALKKIYVDNNENSEDLQKLKKLYKQTGDLINKLETSKLANVTNIDDTKIKKLIFGLEKLLPQSE